MKTVKLQKLKDLETPLLITLVKTRKKYSKNGSNFELEKNIADLASKYG